MNGLLGWGLRGQSKRIRGERSRVVAVSERLLRAERRCDMVNFWLIDKFDVLNVVLAKVHLGKLLENLCLLLSLKLLIQFLSLHILLLWIST